MLLGSRNEKTVYAMGLVQQLREEGIRFLKRDQKNKKLWNDVGDDKMREKVSQNLRERQPQLRKKMELDKGQKEKSPERKPRLEKSSQLKDSVVAMETPSQVQSEQQPPVLQPLEESQQGDTADLASLRSSSARSPKSSLPPWPSFRGDAHCRALRLSWESVHFKTIGFLEKLS